MMMTNRLTRDIDLCFHAPRRLTRGADEPAETSHAGVNLMDTLTTSNWARTALSGGARPWSTATPASGARHANVTKPMHAVPVAFNGIARRRSEGST